MKAKILITAVLSFVLAINAYSQVSFSEGISKAKSSNKKILVNIYSENDSWCLKMEGIYAMDNIRNYVNSNFVYVKLNANGSEKITYAGKEYTASSLSKFFGATGYPTHVFLNPDGTVIKFKYNGDNLGSFPGFVDASEFEKILKYFAENKYKDTDLSKVM